MKNFPYLKFIELIHGTTEWLAYRDKGIGGSEGGAIMNLNPYQSAMRIYAEKTGLVKSMNLDNRAMFHGRNLEPYIVDKVWQYLDGYDEGFIKNAFDGKVIRTCREIKGYAINPKYPFIFSSVDRLIDAGQPSYFSLLKDAGMLSAQVIQNSKIQLTLEKDGILEVKTIRSQFAKLWEDGVPKYQIIQCMIYMIVYELDYCEIITFIDGREEKVYIVEIDDELRELIIRRLKHFWEKRVLPGKEAVKKRNRAIVTNDEKLLKEAQIEIDYYMPPPDNSDDCKLFMKEQYTKEYEKIKGSERSFIISQNIHLINMFIKHLNRMKTGMQNQLQEIFNHNKCEVLDYGKSSGYVKLLMKTNSVYPEIGNYTTRDPEMENIVSKMMDMVKTHKINKV